MRHYDPVQMEPANKNLEILHFEDYRSYLKAVLDAKRSLNPAFGLRAFSKSAGFRSPATLSMVINGRRKITAKTSEKIVKALALTGRKRRYFLALTQFNNAESHEEQAFAKAELINIRSVKEETHIEDCHYRCLSEWYYLALYVCVGMKDFVMDPKKLAQRLGRGIHAEQVRTALSDMEAIGMIKKSGDSYVQSQDSPTTTKTGQNNQAVHQCLKQMVNLSLSALDLPVPLRALHAVTISIPLDQIPMAKEKVYKFCTEMNETFSAGEQSGEVYQMNVQLFPLTQLPSTSEAPNA